jgi:hypothetical protein
LLELKKKKKKKNLTKMNDNVSLAQSEDAIQPMLDEPAPQKEPKADLASVLAGSLEDFKNAEEEGSTAAVPLDTDHCANHGRALIAHCKTHQISLCDKCLTTHVVSASVCSITGYTSMVSELKQAYDRYEATSNGQMIDAHESSAIMNRFLKAQENAERVSFLIADQMEEFWKGQIRHIFETGRETLNKLWAQRRDAVMRMIVENQQQIDRIEERKKKLALPRTPTVSDYERVRTEIEAYSNGKEETKEEKDAMPAYIDPQVMDIPWQEIGAHLTDSREIISKIVDQINSISLCVLPNSMGRSSAVHNGIIFHVPNNQGNDFFPVLAPGIVPPTPPYRFIGGCFGRSDLLRCISPDGTVITESPKDFVRAHPRAGDIVMINCVKNPLPGIVVDEKKPYLHGMVIMNPNAPAPAGVKLLPEFADFARMVGGPQNLVLCVFDTGVPGEKHAHWRKAIVPAGALYVIDPPFLSGVLDNVRYRMGLDSIIARSQENSAPRPANAHVHQPVGNPAP